mmetsp:Transcript_59173/g.111568  ORF Transcript_59173/g.111568 Transcript_59173/m.111568 type:complete len:239 (-) Transcript_59173:537-1253(-)
MPPALACARPSPIRSAHDASTCSATSRSCNNARRPSTETGLGTLSFARRVWTRRCSSLGRAVDSEICSLLARQQSELRYRLQGGSSDVRLPGSKASAKVCQMQSAASASCSSDLCKAESASVAMTSQSKSMWPKTARGQKYLARPCNNGNNSACRSCVEMLKNRLLRIGGRSKDSCMSNPCHRINSCTTSQASAGAHCNADSNGCICLARYCSGAPSSWPPPSSLKDFRTARSHAASI